MSPDRPVVLAAIVAVVFLAGAYAGEYYTERRYVESRLTPCPKQSGFKQVSSVWSKEEGQQCFYRPELPKLPGKPSRKTT